MEYKKFVFSPFQENTYLLFDETKKCIVVDPGNYFPNENEQLDAFILENNLSPVQIVNTHNHLDHVFGSRYIADKYQISAASHPDDNFLITNFKTTAQTYGLNIESEPPMPSTKLEEGQVYSFGETNLEIIHVPGHSPGGVALYYKEGNLLFCGDILFQQSIGRTDLPGGNHEQLLSGIREKLFTLPDETVVLSGHGPNTSIGFEKKNNPFFQ